MCLVISHQSLNLAAWGWLWALVGWRDLGVGFSWRLAVDPIRQGQFTSSVTQRSCGAQAQPIFVPPPCQPASQPAMPCPATRAALRCNIQRPIGPFPHLRHLAARKFTDAERRIRTKEESRSQRFHHPNNLSERCQAAPVALTASNNLPELPGTDLECGCLLHK